MTNSTCKFYLAVLIFVLPLMCTATSLGAVPDTINYQGRLVDSGGVVIDGTQMVRFDLYNVDTGGSSLWHEERTILVSDGIFEVKLGSDTGFGATVFENPTLYLEVQLFSGSSWETLIPRLEITSTAYAMKAANADTLGGVDSSAFATSSHDHDADYVNVGEANSVNSAMIVTGGVESSEVADNSLTAADLAPNSVTASEIAASAVGSSEITDNSVTYVDLADGTARTEILDDDGPGSGLDADYLDSYSESAFFRLSDNETVNGRPAFNGGTTGSTSPFTVDSTTLVTGLNADLLDGWHADSFAPILHSHHSLNASDMWPVNALYIDDLGFVGIGLTDPAKPLHVGVDSSDVEYALKLENDNIFLNSGVGILFAPGGDGPNRGKGALVYKYTNTWNRGDFHFLQRSDTNDDIVDINDSAMIIRNDGNIGIGTTTPTAKLDVAGDVHVVGDITWSPKTSYLSIPAAAFHPGDDTDDFYNSGWVLLNNSSDQSSDFVAPVVLPNGANIVAIKAAWSDNSDSFGSLYLRRHQPFLAREDMALLVTSDWEPNRPGDVESIETLISEPLVDNSRYDYYFFLTLPPNHGADGVSFYRVIIEYTTTQAQ